MKKITALILVLLSVICLASCKEETDVNVKTVITVGDTEIPIAAYYAELFGYKNDFLINYLGYTEDVPELWTQDSPSGGGESVGDTLTKMALEDMVQFAWVVEYASDNGAVLSDEDYEQIDEAIAEVKDGFETEEAYQEYLHNLKFDDESFRGYLELTFLYDKGFTMLVAENGLYPIPDEAYTEFYSNNFYTAKHIFINNVYKEDEEGETIELTEDEIAEKKAKAEEIYSDLESGIPFDTLYMLSEDQMSTQYPDGLTFTEGMIDENYEEAVKALEVGEYTKIDGQYGGIYIIMRVELSEEDADDYSGYIESAVQSEIKDKIYTEHKNEAVINYDVVNTYKIEDIPVQG